MRDRRPVAIVLGSLLVASLFSVAGAASIHHIHGLAVDPRDPEMLYVATHTGLVRVRAGRDPEPVGEQRLDLMGFTAHPGDPTVVWASGHPDVVTYQRERVGNLGLLVSRDGGRTWQSVALKGQADFHALTWSPRDGGTLYGWNVADQPGLFRIPTRTWAPARLEARGLGEAHALSASPDPTGPILAGTPAGLRASRDGGETWSAVTTFPPAPATAVAHHPADARVAYAYVNATGAGLMRTRDGGETWEATGYASAPWTPVIAIAVGPGERVAVATTAADVLRSRDGGRTWETLLARGRAAGR